jgi:hypothetical protein
MQTRSQSPAIPKENPPPIHDNELLQAEQDEFDAEMAKKTPAERKEMLAALFELMKRTGS